MPKLKTIGEQELIQRIARWCGPTPVTNLLKTRVPLGDDAYVANLASSSSLVLTTDTLIEGTHFRFDYMKRFYPTPQAVWRSLGQKAAAVNLSDLAAMGGATPVCALLTLGINGDISVDIVDNLYTGLQNFSKTTPFSIVGGDIIRSDKSIISLTLVGTLPQSGPVLTRDGAKIGDLVLLTGPLGHSAAGLEILKAQAKCQDPEYREFIQAHLEPTPKMAAGRILRNQATLATSLMDTSDDLWTSLEILSRMSQVGFSLNLSLIPFSRLLYKAAQSVGQTPEQLFLYGGEDYQLLFTLPTSRLKALQKALPNAYVIGQVIAKSRGIEITKNNKPVHLRDKRYRHFI